MCRVYAQAVLSRSTARGVTALIVVGAFALPAVAGAAHNPLGKLMQLKAAKGCVTDRAKPADHCAKVRALRGPGPFLGSNALAMSPDGKNLYVASSKSNAIAVLGATRAAASSRSAPELAGCIAARRAGRLRHGRRARASELGRRERRRRATSTPPPMAATPSRPSPATPRPARSPRQPTAAAASPTRRRRGCTTGRALDGADVVVVSPDGQNVYVGAFFGNAVATFSRDPATGALTQPAGDAGCITDTATSGCATGLALAAPEGMAISADGNNVYAATAVSNAIAVLARDPSTGALSQATDGTGCIADAVATGLHDGPAAGRRERRRRQPGRRRRLRHLAAQQQPHELLARDRRPGS